MIKDGYNDRGKTRSKHDINGVKRIYSGMTNSKPLPAVSVITVTYNNVDQLRDTIDNVKLHSYENLEYIIVDGGSSDKTVELIRKHEDFVKCWVSEPDAGIYDAMNKGVELAIGEWILFMNAGDRFFSIDVLDRIFSEYHFDDVSVIYGDHEVRYQDKMVLRRGGSAAGLWRGSQFCHQSTLIRARILREQRYKVKYKFAADFEWLWRMRRKIKMQKLNLTISSVLSGGVSDKRRCDVYKEFAQICANPISSAYFTFQCFLFKLKKSLLHETNTKRFK